MKPEQSLDTDYSNQEKDLVNHLTAHLPIGIYRTTVDGKIVYANQALARMLEFSLDEIHKLSVSDLFFDQKERQAEIDILTEKGKTTTKQIISLKTKTGKEIIVKDTVKIVRDKSGEVIYFDGILEDITQKQRAETALIESEARYKILTDLTMEGIIIHDKGSVVDINPSATKLTGYSLDYIKGRSVLEFIHPDSIDLAKEKLHKQTSEPYELRIIRADKTSFIAELEAKNVLIDGKELRVVAFKDITDRKRIEQEILSLSTAVKQSPTSIVITNTDGIIEYVNPKFTEVTGYTFEEAIGENPNILKTENTTSEDYKEMWEMITRGETWTGEFLNKKKDGTHYWELASISPIINEDGETIRYIAVKEDITERKKTEVALINSEKQLSQANATKNMFFSIIAHDLKGPVGNISQVLKLFKDNFNDISNDEKIDYLNIILGLSEKTNKLLDDLLLWARIQMNTIEITFEEVNLKRLIHNTTDIVSEKAAEKNIKIVSDINNITLKTNESSLSTVIRNILSNAIKFSHDNSEINISTKIPESNNKVIISVQDQGVGIPQESVNKLFKIETSFTTYGTNNEKGTGLGLILCKELIEKINGSIWVKSKEDEGSTFFIALPLQYIG
jgi:PAS domain S-box-containing protein